MCKFNYAWCFPMSNIQGVSFVSLLSSNLSLLIQNRNSTLRLTCKQRWLECLLQCIRWINEIIIRGQTRPGNKSFNKDIPTLPIYLCFHLSQYVNIMLIRNKSVNKWICIIWFLLSHPHFLTFGLKVVGYQTQLSVLTPFHEYIITPFLSVVGRKYCH